MRCFCGLSYRKPEDFIRHYAQPHHKKATNLIGAYPECNICYNFIKSTKFRECQTCHKHVCVSCCTNIYNSSLGCYRDVIKCPFCRSYIQFR